MGRDLGASYDDVPYQSEPYAQTHPANVGAVATLFGMAPAPVDRCRVLELGCASGGNLIPMSMQLPESRFLGIDLSALQVSQGQKTIDALGLKNITLRHMSVMDLNSSAGQFDYIIAHGIYSWVPAPVQDKILAICSENLAPEGIAYVSYNAFPGWHLYSTIRDMMLYHSRGIDEPLLRVRKARSLLDAFARALESNQTPYKVLVREALKTLKDQTDSYLLHEYFEEVNEPLYFHQFIARASAKGLSYLGEAKMAEMLASNFGPKVETALNVVALNLIMIEQYLDVLRNRRFRQTLLCHNGVKLTRVLRPEPVLNFYVCADTRPVSEKPDLINRSLEEFKGRTGSILKMDEPLHKMALAYLGEVWPDAVHFTKLFETVRRRLGLEAVQPTGPDGITTEAGALAMSLLRAYAVNIVEFLTYLPLVAHELGERPVASPLARLQAQSSHRVTNLRHQRLLLNDCDLHILRNLDGTRDRAAIVEVLADLIARDVLRLQQANQPVSDSHKMRELLRDAVKVTVDKFAANCLLIA